VKTRALARSASPAGEEDDDDATNSPVYFYGTAGGVVWIGGARSHSAETCRRPSTSPPAVNRPPVFSSGPCACIRFLYLACTSIFRLFRPSRGRWRLFIRTAGVQRSRRVILHREVCAGGRTARERRAAPRARTFGVCVIRKKNNCYIYNGRIIIRLVSRQRNNIETTCQNNNNKRPKKRHNWQSDGRNASHARIYDNNHCDGVSCELAAAYLWIYFYVFVFLFFQMKNTTWWNFSKIYSNIIVRFSSFGFLFCLLYHSIITCTSPPFLIVLIILKYILYGALPQYRRRVQSL